MIKNITVVLTSTEEPGREITYTGTVQVNDINEKKEINKAVNQIANKMSFADGKKGYGKHNNVMLMAAEYEKLKKFEKYEELLDKVSGWILDRGANARNHYDLCIKFAENDNLKKVGKKREIPDELKELDGLSFTEIEAIQNHTPKTT